MTYGRRGGAARAGGGGTPRRRRPAVDEVLAGLAAPMPLGAGVDPLSWSEATFQTEVESYLGTLAGRLEAEYPAEPDTRLLWWHDKDSTRNKRGLPDLLIAGPGGQIWAELKAERTRTNRAALRPEQDVWLGVLMRGGAAAYLWRPSDWQAGAIQNELHRVARPSARPVTAARTGATLPAVRRAKCGCPVDDEGRIGAHTCLVWGPPS